MRISSQSPQKCQKCPFSCAKKWHFERPDLKTESKNLAKHPPKWLGRHLGHAFPFSGEYQANFEKSHTFHRFGGVLPSETAKIEKVLEFFSLWVYNFEFSFGGSPHLYAPLVKRHKQNLEKSVFRDTLLFNLQSAGVGGGDNVKNAPS